MDLYGPEKISIAVSIQLFPLIIFSDSKSPICNLRDPNRVP